MTAPVSLASALRGVASAWAKVLPGAAPCSELGRAPERGLWVAGIDTGSMGIQCTAGSPAEAVLRVCKRVRRELADNAFVASVAKGPKGPRHLKALDEALAFAEYEVAVQARWNSEGAR